MTRIENKHLLILVVLSLFSIAAIFRQFDFTSELIATAAEEIVSAPPPPPYRYKDDVIREDTIQNAASRDVTRFPRDCSDKKWALEILHASDGMFQINETTCTKLPTQQEVIRLYGEDPVVYGMDTCEQFRTNAQQVKNTSHRVTVRVAGLFNTGTNAMAVSLARNLQHRDGTVLLEELFNVPWEKHVPPRFRDENVVAQDRGIDLRLVLPVVLVRDPYWWMQSMCKQSYAISWKKRGENRCPNMVNANGINPAFADYEKKFPIRYDSLVHVWNEWNREYLEADFPRLMVRFEDQLFHGEKVMQLISNCSGIPLHQPYVYQWRESKMHGASSNLVSALSKYGNSRGRHTPFDVKDLEYAKSVLDPSLMEIFGYQHEVHPPRVSHAYRKKLGSAWGG